MACYAQGDDFTDDPAYIVSDVWPDGNLVDYGCEEYVKFYLKEMLKKYGVDALWPAAEGLDRQAQIDAITEDIRTFVKVDPDMTTVRTRSYYHYIRKHVFRDPEREKSESGILHYTPPPSSKPGHPSMQYCPKKKRHYARLYFDNDDDGYEADVDDNHNIDEEDFEDVDGIYDDEEDDYEDEEENGNHWKVQCIYYHKKDEYENKESDDTETEVCLLDDGSDNEATAKENYDDDGSGDGGDHGSIKEEKLPHAAIAPPVNNSIEHAKETPHVAIPLPIDSSLEHPKTTPLAAVPRAIKSSPELVKETPHAVVRLRFLDDHADPRRIMATLVSDVLGPADGQVGGSKETRN